ncbi:MAG: hypothetical protein M5T52_05960 [Ignavibacteriaceae bacterium]|nr:hypothetical protein [Ignavibacteriaceae bacterium]
MRILKIFLLVFILSITISAQWYQQNSGTTDNLYSVYFVNELVDWATTYQVIYKTTDGGQSWQYQYTQNPVFQIFFHSENVGWISTWLTGPAILETTDGGNTWVEIYSVMGSYEFIHDFEFISPDIGWIVGEETIRSIKDGITEFPVLFKETTNGGLTWLDKNFPPNYWGRLAQIDAIDYMNLIVAGDDTLLKLQMEETTGNKYHYHKIFNLRILILLILILGGFMDPMLCLKQPMVVSTGNYKLSQFITFNSLHHKLGGTRTVIKFITLQMVAHLGHFKILILITH